MARYTASLALLVLGGATAACSSVFPYEKDPLAVIERYPHRVGGECSVWLESHISGFSYCASPKIDLAMGAPVPAGPVKVVVGAASSGTCARGSPGSTRR